MDKNTQVPAVRVGVDLSRRVIQVHAVDAGGRPHMRFVPVQSIGQQRLRTAHSRVLQ